jgi:ubiquinone/menaquinone biosynthesis C-methylase UbiE
MASNGNETPNDGTYTMGRSREETERLILQSQLYERVTLRLLGEAGIVRGMRVLDVGSGSGDVAFAAAELVGSEGEVIGAEVNGEILKTARERAKEAGLANVTFVEGDARTLDPSGDFDAVIGRLVLMYMSDPADALKQLTAWLRPGGIVAFQEVDFTPYRSLAHEDTPLMNNLIDWVIEVFQRSGAHVGMGTDLYRTFVDAGLPEPVLDWTAPVGGPETWSGYEYVGNSFRSLLPLIEEYGIATSQEVDVDTLAERLRREVVSAKRPVILPPHVTAWTRVAT